MSRYLIFLLAAIVVSLIGMYRIGSIARVYRGEIVAQSLPHRFNDSGKPINVIEIKAFYVVPKNKTASVFPNWASVIEKNLKVLIKFHGVQLRGLSTVTFDIYPEPITGKLENLGYDTDVTQNGNPAALRAISQELQERVFSPAGDLYRNDFARANPGAYRVLYIIYEGVGAAGSENTAILSRVFLTDPQYANHGRTYLVHEFYHTLGLPDAYNIPQAISTDDDIMGLGRERPIEQSYISQNHLKGLGL